MPALAIHALLMQEPKRVDLKPKLGANLKGTWIRRTFVKVIHIILKVEKGCCGDFNKGGTKGSPRRGDM